ncbi:UNVERIFIED_CONTAM: hypothetical protein Scaly_0105300 [Sesamum calycinum]|uniref:Uncharacterized protein n=1 Tax=Sesamum calycinum TaxID=2727403 RepID=A0AAW2SWD4_9LAMI
MLVVFLEIWFNLFLVSLRFCSVSLDFAGNYPLTWNLVCQNVHSIVVLPDRGTPNLQNELPLNISYVEIPNFVKSEMCLNSEPDLQNQINLKVDKLNNYAPCVLDVDIEKGKAEIPKSNEESAVILKSDDSVAKTFQREICFQIGGKFMQLLMKHGVELPKFTSRGQSSVLVSTDRRGANFTDILGFFSLSLKIFLISGFIDPKLVVEHGNDYPNISNTESEANQ